VPVRKPSCLISCSQSAWAGGALAGDGGHGPMKPIVWCSGPHAGLIVIAG
jgi:hypothetical protein